MILLRTTRIDDQARALADRLRVASGLTVAMLVDERRTPSPTDLPKVAITDAACAARGLYTPGDYTWRCGDYGFYLARHQFPGETHYWMIEYDVAISGDAARFFATCAAHPDIDLLAADVRPTARDWWWCANVAASDVQPYRCFFPVVRLSAHAVDALAAKRRAQSRRPLRRLLWPNDESFVATAAVAAGLSIADLNDLGERFYDAETYSYTNVIDGARFVPDSAAPRLHHPVLFGEDLARKLQRLKDDHSAPTPLPERAYRKIVAAANGATRW